jgi:CBS domain-containing protein
MRVKDVMRKVWALDAGSTLGDVVDAMQTTGCEAQPIVENGGGELVIRQLVFVRDLPGLRRIAASRERGHAIGEGVLDLLAALGRAPGRFPAIGPDASLADAWGLMSDENMTHLPVIDGRQILGMVSLVVSFSEFPHRSPGAGFW